jgi:hypothetical protein
LAAWAGIAVGIMGAAAAVKYLDSVLKILAANPLTVALLGMLTLLLKLKFEFDNMASSMDQAIEKMVCIN